MSFIFSRHALDRLLLALLLGLAWGGAQAQPTGLLYDPQPPADSAYVRVILATPQGAVDVVVDGQPRIAKLAARQTSDYMVLTAGRHTLALHPVGKARAHLTTTLEVVQGRALTLAFPALQAATEPVIFEDKANSNKLKALVAVYHLDARVGPLDVLTADGATQVFSGVVYGGAASIQVNPMAVDLIVTPAGSKTPQARTSLAMKPGGTYSVLLLPGAGGKLTAHTTQNKIERYTGK